MVKTEKELAQALKENKNYIEIEGDLARKVFKIKATGKIAWTIAIAAIAAGAAITISTAGAGLPTAHGLVAISTVSTLGVGATTTAIAIAVAAGGVGVLNKLREYKLEKISDNHIKLTRK